MRRGFSLVELSIVLVILGLLVGGILAGRSLIKAAEARKTIAFLNETDTAWSAFRDKYFALPGDMTTATEFWGRSTASDWHSFCSVQPGTPSATGTCNGNGDGYITERYGAWEHMKLAGLIGFPTGTGPQWRTYAPGRAGDVFTHIYANNCCGINGLMYADADDAFAGIPNSPSVRGIGLTVAKVGDAFSSLIGAAVQPEEMWNTDTKIDDGLPLTGRFMGSNGTDLAAGTRQPCLLSSGGSYVYNVSDPGVNCKLLYLLRRGN